MTKTLTAEVQRKNAERQLFGARRALAHLVQLYDNGQWRQLYKEDAFADAVRQARQAVDHWTEVLSRSGTA
jgi:predicted P-loop ATPase